MKKYHGIDWLRALACIGIMLMHVAANNQYAIGGFVYQQFIPSLTDFVFLFMAVSAFGMCCGYFDKVVSGSVNWTDFYKKRYWKILPFFLLLILIDLALNFRVSSLYEGLIEATLLHGLIPNTLSVIGVGWFLGTVFVFYLIFPFFCVLIGKKHRAWVAFAIAIGLNFICSAYFDLGRSNFVYSLCYFLAGGLIYLYKDKIEKVKWYFSVPVLLAAIACFYLIGANTLTRLFLTAALLGVAISVPFPACKPIAFLSNISMEFYLSHMVIFKGIELFRLNTLLGDGWVQYLFTVILVLTGTVIFSFCVQKLFVLAKKLLLRVIHRQSA